MREKDYTLPVLNLVFHVKLWMKHGLRGQNETWPSWLKAKTKLTNSQAIDSVRIQESLMDWDEHLALVFDLSQDPKVDHNIKSFA